MTSGYTCPMVVGILVPILIAGFFGYVFGGVGGKKEVGKVPVAIVDEDQSAVSRAIVQDLSTDRLVKAQILDRAAASNQVLTGKTDVAVVLPRGFAVHSTRALYNGRDKPVIELLVDPSKSTSVQLVQGLLAQYAMQQISRDAFSGPQAKALQPPNCVNSWAPCVAGTNAALRRPVAPTPGSVFLTNSRHAR
jgi:ABC-2 type transport system permease protein